MVPQHHRQGPPVADVVRRRELQPPAALERVTAVLPDLNVLDIS
jgi:hypothetical protein